MNRILVIDDDYQVQKVIRLMLENAGYEVEVASNGKIGVRLFQKKPADIVITDIIMPEQEGLETIMDLRRHSPEVKIIAISGGGRVNPDTYLTTAKTLGAHRVFTKPVARDELLNTVKELLA